jgi:hydrogenase 3 maturation protease
LVETIKKNLQNQLLNAKRVAVLGIGSELLGDDGVGMWVAGKIESFANKSKQRSRLQAFFGCTAPENVTGQIKRFNPTHIIIVDAGTIGEAAGAIKLISPEQIEGVSFSTHRLPLKFLAQYLIQSLGCAIIFIVIQPKSLEFGKPLTAEVRKSAQELLSVLKEAVLGK